MSELIQRIVFALIGGSLGAALLSGWGVKTMEEFVSTLKHEPQSLALKQGELPPLKDLSCPQFQASTLAGKWSTQYSLPSGKQQHISLRLNINGLYRSEAQIIDSQNSKPRPGIRNGFWSASGCLLTLVATRKQKSRSKQLYLLKSVSDHSIKVIQLGSLNKLEFKRQGDKKASHEI